MSQYTREEIMEKVKRGEKGLSELKGAELVKADLREANLTGVNFGGANLRGANLRGAILDEANLVRINLEGADLRGAKLRGASLGEAKLWGANLGISNLLGASLRGAVLDGANLIGANLDGANLAGANLERADIRGASLRGVDLRATRLWGANLWEADLRGADMSAAELCSAILSQADLRGANINGANIWGIVRDGWKIEGINAEYVYNCSTPWVKGAKEKTRQNFGAGEFERLCKSRPTVEMLFIGGLSPLEYVKLVGLSEIIRQEKPELNLEIKSLERLGMDTILRFTLSRDDYLEEVVRLIARSCRDWELTQKLLLLLKEEYGIQLETKLDQRIFNKRNISKIVVNVIKQTGESQWKGEMGDIDIGEQEFLAGGAGGGSGKRVNYNIRQAVVDTLLVEGAESKQDLTEALADVLRGNEKKKLSDLWS